MSELRPEVKEFAEWMEMKLMEHDEDRSGYRGLDEEWCKQRIDEELIEFYMALKEKNITRIYKEGADVANFIMFICFNRKENWIEESADLLQKSGFFRGGR